MQTKRGAEAYERDLRKQLVYGTWTEIKKEQTPTLEDLVERA